MNRKVDIYNMNSENGNANIASTFDRMNEYLKKIRGTFSYFPKKPKKGGKHGTPSFLFGFISGVHNQRCRRKSTIKRFKRKCYNQLEMYF